MLNRLRLQLNYRRLKIHHQGNDMTAFLTTNQLSRILALSAGICLVKLWLLLISSSGEM
ncbi:hypothetical protein AALB_0307 [Agarivorans albus MKT 106]|uniref:Uncharacterized protein n=1 Tax=Agarivorans albus MKT 106 TaxID=1331007 RepID=R9PFV5_AGAAL|nr:hypothetical protein AALB_0307 [Agarivorans albus MKT 106]